MTPVRQSSGSTEIATGGQSGGVFLVVFLADLH